MSAGIFQDGKYIDNDGNIYAVRVQPETKGLTAAGGANTYPTGDVTIPGTLKLRKGKRAFGLIPRTATIRLPLTDQPAGYKPGSLIVVPIFTDTFWQILKTEKNCTYLDAACTRVSVSPEDYN